MKFIGKEIALLGIKTLLLIVVVVDSYFLLIVRGLVVLEVEYHVGRILSFDKFS